MAELMQNKSSSSGSANRIVATLCFWLIPLVGGIIYTAIDMFTRPQVGHGFEYGMTGFQIGARLHAILTTLNTIGFLCVFLLFPRIAARNALRLYLISVAAGVASVFAFISIVWVVTDYITIGSTVLWIVFLVLNAIATSAFISFFLLYGALRIGVLQRWFRPATECQNCGYDLRASSGTCPECGMAYVRKVP